MIAKPRALAAGFAALALAGCISTRPFTDAEGRVLPGSVATMEKVRLGGIDQAVWFRGRDVRAPALVLLHGGPGASESALFRHYDAALEDHFLVVYWEQRGTGRSYGAAAPESMTIAQLLDDLDALVDTVRARFGRARVVVLGHSWGTVLGTIYAHRHPAKVAAYVGVAQIADFARGERISLEWALRQAERRGEGRATRELRAMVPRPRTVKEELTLGRWVERFGGSSRVSMRSLLGAALSTDEASIIDLILFGLGNRFSLEALRPEYSRIDLTRLRRFEVPVVFMLGRHDWHVPSVLAAEYFEMIEAPARELVWFERSAHNPPFEEPEAFTRAMVERVLPIAQETREDGDRTRPADRPPGAAVAR